jgi:hypothetical protein
MVPVFWAQALLGGVIIGIATLLLMFALGRIAGIAGIISNLLPPVATDWQWRLLFLLGLIAGPWVVAPLIGHDPIGLPAANLPKLALAGLLVGIGTTLSHGCTSGHALCGVSRLSLRSLAATVTFMLAGGIVLFLVRHVAGW